MYYVFPIPEQEPPAAGRRKPEGRTTHDPEPTRTAKAGRARERESRRTPHALLLRGGVKLLIEVFQVMYAYVFQNKTSYIYIHLRYKQASS
jgi:hypothetical protein